MKIFRWLLCHLLSIIIILSAILIYVFRSELKEDFYRLSGSSVSSNSIHSGKAGQPSGQPVQQPELDGTGQGKESKRKQEENRLPENVAANSTAWGDRVMPDRQAGKHGTVADTPVTASARDPWNEVLPATVANSAPAATAASQQTPSAVDSAVNFPPENYDPENAWQEQPVEGKSDGGSSGIDNTTPPEIARVGSSVEQTVDSQRPDEYFRALEEVRQLYWNGNTPAARAAYEKLMFDYPEQPEAAAELGNIFLRQGDRKGASWAYQNAIPRYLNLHREEEAINLMRFISQFDPAIADSLQKKYW